MSQGDKHETSRSLVVYGLLLHLYPREYVQHHRPEMLQNFEDFESASLSKIKLWSFFGKDLAMSLTPQLVKTLWGQTAVVFMVLIVVLLAAARRHPGRNEHSVWGFCVGYLLGWFTGWWRKGYQLRFSSPRPS